MAVWLDLVAERLEERAEESLAAAAGNRCDASFQRQRRCSELRLALTPSAEGRVEPAGEDDREQRRGDVRPIVHVLVLGAAFAATAADHADRIDIEQDRGLAGVLRRFRVEDGGAAEWELPCVDVVRVFVE